MSDTANEPATTDLAQLLDQAQQLQADLARDDLEFEFGEMLDHVYNLESLMRRAQQAGTDERATANAARARKLFEEFLLGRDRGELEQIEHWQHYYDDIEGARADAIQQQRIDDFFNFDTEVLPAEQVAPSGYGQRIANVLAIAGVNQARDARARIQADYDQARAHGSGAVEMLEVAIEHQRGVANESLQQIAWSNRWSLASSLAEALTWNEHSEIAATALDELRSAFAQQWGVVVDPEQMQVSLDPGFDPIAAQTYVEASALFARQSAVIEQVDELSLAEATKTAATQALLRWRGESIDEDPAAALAAAEQRRVQLAADLDAAGITGDDRARIDFVVDYLTGNTSDIDLLASPVWVDPGEEVRGRIPELLHGFETGYVSAQKMAAEISVMTKADQARVREVGKAIRDGREPETELWRGYINRDEFGEEVFLLAGDVEDIRAIADYLAENDISNENPESWGVRDETAETIERLRERGDEIVAVATTAHGLADVERRQLVAIVDDVDAGRFQGRKDIPELLFADEHSKRQVDQQRIGRAANVIANGMRTQVDEILAATEFDRRSREGGLASFQEAQLHDTIYTVADGAITTGIDHERRRYTDLRAKFGQALAAAGVGAEHRDRIRATIDAAAHQAGIVGKAAADRNERWAIKSERIAMIRDDQLDTLAQQRAADKGRAHPPEAAVDPEAVRACTAQINQSHGNGVTAGPAGLRQLHQTGIER